MFSSSATRFRPGLRVPEECESVCSPPPVHHRSNLGQSIAGSAASGTASGQTSSRLERLFPAVSTPFRLSWRTRRSCCASSLASTVLRECRSRSVVSPSANDRQDASFRYGGNPLGCAVAMTALDVLIDEDLVNRAQQLGELFRSKVEAINSPFITQVRGRGLLNAVIIDESKSTKGRGAWELCLLMKSKGYVKLYSWSNASAGTDVGRYLTDYWPSLLTSTCEFLVVR